MEITFSKPTEQRFFSIEKVAKSSQKDICEKQSMKNHRDTMGPIDYVLQDVNAIWLALSGFEICVDKIWKTYPTEKKKANISNDIIQ